MRPRRRREMRKTAQARHFARRGLAWAGIAATLLLAVGGCATQAREEQQSANLVTPSDESETHRRARIRLELAVGYFEQGKTDIALDELKQAMVIDPSNAEAYNLRGMIYMRLNDA